MKSFLATSKKHIAIIILIIFGLSLRLFIAFAILDPQYGRNDDLLRYQDWGRVGYEMGVPSTYDSKNTSFGIYANNQMPGTAYLNIAMSATYKTFFSTSQTTSHLYDIFIKLPSIFSDLLITVFIYVFVKKQKSDQYATIAAGLFLLNPVTLYNSAVWGQTDSLNNLLFFLSVISLIYKKYFLSILMFALSLYIKLSVLPFLPFILLIILKQKSISLKRLILTVALVIIIILTLTLPVSSNPLLWLIQFFNNNSKGELQHITNYAFNFWAVIFNPDSFALVPDSSQIYLGLQLSVWAYLIFALFYILICLNLYKSSKINSQLIFKLLILIAFSIFLFLPRMHERYLYPLFPLMATYIGLTNKHYISYLLLSALNFINLYIVWHPSNFLPAFFTDILVHSKARLSLGVLTTLIFLYLFTKLLRSRSDDSID